MALRTGSKVTIKVDDGFLGRTGEIVEVDKDPGTHAKCSDAHYFVDVDATDDAPAEPRVMFHAADFG